MDVTPTDARASTPSVPLSAAAAELLALLEALNSRRAEAANGDAAPATRTAGAPESNGAPPETSALPAAPGRAPSSNGASPPARTFAGQAITNGSRAVPEAANGTGAASPEVKLSGAWRQFLAEFQRSDGRWIIVVRPDQPGLYEFFKQAFFGVSDIEVRLDRRGGEERRRTGPTGTDRRAGERRGRPEVDAALRSSGFAFVDLPKSPDDPNSKGANPRGPAQA